MGLLDNLRSEADARKVADARDRVVGDRRSAEAEASLRPRMVALHRYFKEFIEHLAVIDPDVTSACHIAEFGRIDGLRQTSYRFWTDQPDDPTKFTFGFTASSRERPQQRLPHAVADKTMSELHAASIPCKAGQVGGDYTTLVLQPEVPVLFEFQMDVEQAVVRLTLRNLERVGTFSYTYRADDVTEELMEELGLLVLGKPNRFKVISGGLVEDDDRADIRRALDKEDRRRHAELGGPLARLRWLLGEGVRKLLGKD